MQSQSPTTFSKTWNLRWIFAGFVMAVLAAVGVGRWLGVRVAHETLAERAAAASPTPTSADVATADALSNYLDKIQGQVREHEAAFARMHQQNALTWNIHRREDIERDRQIIRIFLLTNDRLTDGLQYGADFLRAEMNAAKTPAAERDAVLARYAKMEEPLRPLQMRVRQSDQTLGETALAVLDLLEINWGAWKRDEATGRIDFTNTVTLAAFQDYVGKLSAAADERQEAQKELSEYQQRHPALP